MLTYLRHRLEKSAHLTREVDVVELVFPCGDDELFVAPEVVVEGVELLGEGVAVHDVVDFGGEAVDEGEGLVEEDGELASRVDDVRVSEDLGGVGYSLVVNPVGELVWWELPEGVVRWRSGGLWLAVLWLRLRLRLRLRLDKHLPLGLWLLEYRMAEARKHILLWHESWLVILWLVLVLVLCVRVVSTGLLVVRVLLVGEGEGEEEDKQSFHLEYSID
jgi:hypothetical protein